MVSSQIFNLLPVQSVSGYSYSVEDEQECLHVRPRRALLTDNVYESLKVGGSLYMSDSAVDNDWVNSAHA